MNYNNYSNENKYISLAEASQLCSYSQEYLGLRSRQGKLRAVKIGRDWMTTEYWLSEYVGEMGTKTEANKDNGQKAAGQHISLREAAINSPYSRDYLSLRVRQGKLKAVKHGRNWVTKKEWVDDYVKSVGGAVAAEATELKESISPASTSLGGPASPASPNRGEASLGGPVGQSLDSRLPSFAQGFGGGQRGNDRQGSENNNIESSIQWLRLKTKKGSGVFDKVKELAVRLSLQYKALEEDLRILQVAPSLAGNSVKYLRVGFLTALLIGGAWFLSQSQAGVKLSQGVFNALAKTGQAVANVPDFLISSQNKISAAPMKIAEAGNSLAMDVKASGRIIFQAVNESAGQTIEAAKLFVWQGQKAVVSLATGGAKFVGAAPSTIKNWHELSSALSKKITYRILILPDQIAGVFSGAQESLAAIGQIENNILASGQDFLINWSASAKAMVAGWPAKIKNFCLGLDSSNEKIKNQVTQAIGQGTDKFNLAIGNIAKELSVSNVSSFAYDKYLVWSQAAGHAINDGAQFAYRSFNDALRVPGELAVWTGNQFDAMGGAIRQRIATINRSVASAVWRVGLTLSRAANFLAINFTPHGQLANVGFFGKNIAQGPTFYPWQAGRISSEKINQLQNEVNQLKIAMEKINFNLAIGQEANLTPEVAPPQYTIGPGGQITQNITQIQNITQNLPAGDYAKAGDLVSVEERLQKMILSLQSGAVAQSNNYTTNNFYSWAPSQRIDNLGNVTIASISLTGGLNQTTNEGISFMGNVKATNGLDVSGANFTVGGTNFVVDNSGNLNMAGNLTVGGNQTLTGDLTVIKSSYLGSNISTSTLTVKGPSTFTVSSSTEALYVTQYGIGAGIVINASSSTSTLAVYQSGIGTALDIFQNNVGGNLIRLQNATGTLFLIDGFGQVTLGTTTADTSIRGRNIFTQLGDDNSLYNFALKNFSGSNLLTVNSGGNLTLNANATSSIFGDVAFDANTLFIDSINNRVGLGTTSPLATFSIQGTVPGQVDLFTIATSTGANLLAFNANGNLGIASSSPSFVLSLVGNSYFNGNHYQQGNATTTGFLNIGQLLSVSGVGTSTFASNLSVGGSFDATGTSYFRAPLLLADGSATAPAMSFIVDQNTGLFRPAADSLAFSTGGSEWVRVDATGNVGIGTTSPAATLHVVDTTTQLRLAYNAANYTNLTAALDGALTISTTNTGTTTITNAFQAASSFYVLNNGLVGIQTTSPLYNLDVNGTLRTTGSVVLGDNVSSDLLTLNSRVNTSIIPSADNTYDLGDGTNWLRWRTGYFGTSVGIGGQATSTGVDLLANGAYLIDSKSTLSLNTTNNQPVTFGSGKVTLPYASSTAITVSGTASTTNLYVSNLAYLSPMTQGSVFFSGANGLISQDNSNLFWNDLANRLGINTASPLYTLDVNGAGRFTSYVDASYFTATTTNATSTFAGGLAADTNGLVFDWQTKNVGIGTASAAYKLDVNGTLRTTGSVTLGDLVTSDLVTFNSRINTSLIPSADNQYDLGDATNWLRWRTGYFGTSVGIGGQATSTGVDLLANGAYLIDSKSTLSLNTTNNQPVTFGSGLASFTQASTTRFSVFNNAYFGATATSTFDSTGVLTLASPLVVTSGGTGLGAGGLKAAFIPFGAGASAFATSTAFKFESTTSLLTVTNASTTLLTASYASSTLGYFGTAYLPTLGTTAGSVLAVNATGQIIATSTLGVSNLSLAKGNFLVGNDSGVAQATSTIFISSTGNVGIGTSSPLSRLSIQGSDATSANSALNVANGNGTSVLFVRNDGNVGIGTTGPRSALDVRSANVAYNSGNPQLFVGTTAVSQTAGEGGQIGLGTYLAGIGVQYPFASLKGIYETGSNKGALLFMTMNDDSGITEKMRINGSGNVGIGTTNPGAKLTVRGSSSSSYESAVFGTSDWTTSVGSGLVIRNGAATGNTYTELLATIGGWGSYGNLVLNSGGGNVGIGTTSPTSLLQVSGATPKFYLSNTSGAVDGKHWFLSNASGDFSLGTTSDSLATNSTYLTVKGSTGNVGIGTTGPGAKLEVNGNLTLAAGSASAAALRFSNTDTDTGIFYSGNNTVGITAGSTDYIFNDAAFYRNTGGGFYILYTVGTAAAPTYSFNGYSTNGMFRHTGLNELGFSTNGTERLSITGANGDVNVLTGVLTVSGTGNSSIAGNVGIGTTTPTSKLQVSGATPKFYLSNTSGAVDGKHWFLSNASGDFSLGTTSDSLATNSTYLTVKGSTGNVGIGTSSPLSRLSIQGSDATSANSALNVANGNGTSVLFVRNDGNVGIGTTSPSYVLDVSPASGVTSDLFRAASSTTGLGLVVKNNGNVGIGTTSPQRQLHINGTGGTRLRITDSGTYPSGSGIELGYNAAGKVFLWNNENSALGIGTNNSEIVTLSTTGNVGIGTSSPLSRLSIQGSDATSANSALNVANGNGTSVLFVRNDGNVGIGTTGPGAKLQVSGGDILLDLSSNLKFGTGSTIQGDASFLYFYSGSAWRATIGSAGFRPYTDDSIPLGDTTRRWSALSVGSGVSSFAGNVGIGTTTPGTLLGMRQTTSGDMLTLAGMGSSAGTSNAGIMFRNTYGTTYNAKSAAIRAIWQGPSNWGTDLAFYTRTETGSSEETEPTEWMRITKTGNVGIGTTSPGYLLHVSGSAGSNLTIASAVENTNSGGFSSVLSKNDVGKLMGTALQGSANTYYAPAGSALFYTNSAAGMGFVTSDTSHTSGIPAMFILPTGNVGIGTTSPGAKLHIVDGLGTLPSLFSTATGVFQANDNVSDLARVFIIGGSSGNSEIDFGDSDDSDIGAISYYHSNDSLRFATNNSEKVTITSTGNVGIGTTTPGSLLHTYSLSTTNTLTVESDGSSAILKLDSSSLNSSQTNIDYYAAGSRYWSVGLSGDNTGNYTIGDGGYTNKFVTVQRTTGNVGIGTTTPTSKLQVSGATPKFYLSNTSGAVDGKHWFLSNASGDFSVGTTSDSLATNSTYLTVKGSTGNVGIGTTSPTSLLQVSGATPKFYLSNTSGALDGKHWFLSNASGDFSLGTTSDSLATNSTYLTVKGSTGNVGIGTSSPLSRLSIQGSDATSANSALNVANGNGTSVLFVRNDGNVGIGTTTPGARLTVNDSLGGVAIFDSTSANGLYTTYKNSGTIFGYIGSHKALGGPSITDFTVRSENNLILAASGVEKVRITTDGNVGIGTSSPLSRLSIQGSDATSANSALNVANGNGTSVLFVRNDGNVGIGTTTPWGKLAINQFNGGSSPLFVIASSTGSSATSTLFIVDKNGNVGIGTTNPGAKLDVWNGNIYLSNSSVDHGMTDVNVSPTNSYALFQPMSGTAGGLNILGFSDTDAGGLTLQGIIGSDNPTDTTPASLFLSYKKNGTGGQALASAETAFQFRNYVNNLVTILGNGNVGIGTTSPYRTLSVNGTFTAGNSTDGLTVEAGTGVVNVTGIDISGTAYNDVALRAGGVGTGVYIKTDGNVGIGTSSPLSRLSIQGSDATSANSALNVANGNGTSVLFVRNDGNVGIGTTSPGAKLNIIGSTDWGLVLDNSTSDGGVNPWYVGATGAAWGAGDNKFVIGMDSVSANAKLVIQNSGNVGIGTSSPLSRLSIQGSDATSANSALNVANGNGTSVLFVRNDGNVGIGTTTPNALLNIASTLPRFYLSDTDFAANGHWFLENNAGVFSLGTTSSALAVSDTRALSITTDGNVGIGTTAPLSFLHIKGAETASYMDLVIQSTDGATSNSKGGISFLDSNGTRQSYLRFGNANGGVVLMNENSSGVLNLGTNATTRLVIDSSGNFAFNTSQLYVQQSTGNVGIGTTSPWGKLAINQFNGGSSPLFVIASSTGSSATSTLFIVDKNGNVGIGTTTPSALLNVNQGTLQLTGSSQVAPSGGSGLEAFYNGTNGVVQAYNRTGLAYLPLSLGGSNFSFNNAVAIGGGSYSGSNAPSGGLIVSGNVGIGTSSPLSRLSIQGSDATSANSALNVANGNGTSVLFVRNDGNVGIGTTSPSYVLDVSPASGVTSDLFRAASSTTGLGLVVKNNGNVGIGTTAPGAKLHVLGSDGAWSSTFKGNLNVAGAADNSLSVGSYSASPYGVWLQAGDNRVSATTYPLLLNPISGNVGIGTTSPTSLLQVSGATPKFYLSNTSGALDGKHWFLSNASGDFSLGTTSDSLATNSTYLTVKGSTGNVGIGTSSPLSRLSIQGSDATSANSALNVANGNGTSVLFVRNDGNVGIGTTAPGQVLDVNGNAILSGAGRTMQIGSSGASWLYFTNANNNIQYNNNQFAFNTTQTNGFTFNGGNVGIGTTTPTSKLQVSGATPKFYLSNTSGAVDGKHWFLSNASGDFSLGTTSDSLATNSTYLTVKGSTGNVGIGTSSPLSRLSIQGSDATSANSALNVANGNGTSVLFVRNDGNVGIGTTAPNALLNIASTLPRFYLSDTDFAANGHWFLENNAGVFSLGTTSSALAVSGTRALSITNNGNVGIGTTSPSYVLDVSPASGVTSDLFRAASSTTGLGLVVKNNGNVGIGTAIPTAKLEIKSGNLYIDRTTLPNIALNSSGTDYGFIQNDAADTWSLSSGTNMGVLGTPILTWKKGGNVGIGTTTPTSLLQVSGATPKFYLSNTSGAVDGKHWFLSNASGDFSLGTTSDSLATNSTYLTVKGSTGNVGIGTTNPLSLLQVGTLGANANYAATIGQTGKNGLYINSGGSYYDIYTEHGAGISGGISVGTYAGTQAPSGGAIISGNVGIGTTNPGAKLEVVGTARASTLHILEGAGADSGYGGSVWANTSDWATNLAGNQLGFYTGANSARAVRMFIQNGGNVGIGTTSPNTKLSIFAGGSTAAASPAITFQASSTAAMWNSYWTMGSDLADAGKFKISSSTSLGTSDRLVIDGNGNVGIGTAAPGYKLDVNGNIGNSTGALGIYSGGTNQNISLNPSGTGQTSISQSQAGIRLLVQGMRNVPQAGGVLGIGVLRIQGDGTGVTDMGANVGGAGWVQVESSNTLATYYDYLINPNGGNVNVANGALYAISNGNVGIGTTGPGAKLEVAGTDTVSGTFRLQGYYGDPAYYTNFSQAYGGGGLTITQKSAGSSDTIVNLFNGNVGIGTTTPALKLHVQGTKADPLNSGVTPTGLFGISDAAWDSALYMGIQASSPYGTWLQASKVSDLSFERSISINPFGGNVGIGTTTPNSKLHVNGQVRSESDFVITGVGGMDNSSGLEIYGSASTPIKFSASGSGNNHMYISTAGNVGIGTTEPGAKLDISAGSSVGLNVNGDNIVGITVGNSGLASSGFRVVTAANTANEAYADLSVDSLNAGLRFSSIGSTYVASGYRQPNGAYIANIRNGPLVFAANNAEAMRITSTGNVGIGTTTPTSKLQVSGATPKFYLSNTSGAVDGKHWFLSNASGDFSLGTTSDSLATNSTYLTVKGSTGNVGIGTTEPSALLHLYKQNAVSSMHIQQTGAGNYGAQFQAYTDDSTLLFGAYDDGYTSVAAYTGNNVIQGGGGSLILSAWEAGNDIKFYAGQRTTANVIIKDGGNVGIGTTTPGARLEVLGSADTADIIKLMKYSTGSQRGGLGTASGVGYLDLYNDSTTKAIRLLADGNSYINGGNVGIGTTGPGSVLPNTFSAGGKILEIVSAANGSDAGILIRDNDGTPGLDLWSDGATGNTYIDSRYHEDPTGTGMRFRVATAGTPVTAMTIRSDGNVGIGTSSPLSKLSVQGTSGLSAFIVASSTGATILTVDGTGNTIINTGNVGIGTTSPLAKLAIKGSGATTGRLLQITDSGDVEKVTILDNGNVGIGTTGPGSKLTVNAGNVEIIGGSLLIPNNYDISAKDSGGTYRRLIGSDSSNKILIGDGANLGAIVSIQGNIGIGTTTPAWLTQINGTRPSLALSDSSAGANLKHWLLSSMGGNLYVGTSTDAYATSTPAALTILNNGNVGIGTAPVSGYKLSVNGSIYVPSGYLLDFGSGNADIKESGYALQFKTYDGAATTEKMRITGGGNVGIGTTGPTSKLHLNGSGSTVIRLDDTDDNRFGAITIDNSVLDIWASGAATGVGDITFRTGAGSGVERMRIKDGNVGIGTTSPGAKLSIFDTYANNPLIRVSSDGDKTVELRAPGNSWNAAVGTQTGHSFGLMTNNTYKMVVSSAGGFSFGSSYIGTDPGAGNMIISGNVGIGTTTPTSLLQVSGATPKFYLSNTSGAVDGKHWFLSNASGDFSLGTTSDSLATNSTYLTVKGSTGNVGIGTTSPSVKFAVGGVAGDTTGNAYFTGGLGVGAVNTTSGTLHVTGQCITGDTLLPVRRRRRRKAGDKSLPTSLYESEDEFDCLLVPIREILPGDEVLSLNEAEDTFEYHRINGLLDMGVQEVFELKTKSGRVIRTTAAHPYLVRAEREISNS